MIEHATADLLTVALSGANLILLVTLAFRFGRWMGTVDTRLAHLEKELEQEG